MSRGSKSQSDRKLRCLPRLDYRELDDEDEPSFEEDDTLLAGDVTVIHQSDSSLNITPAVAEVHDLPNCSTPLDRERFSTSSVSSDFGPFVTVSPVEGTDCEQSSIDEDHIEIVRRLSLVSVGDNILSVESTLIDESSYVSSVEDRFTAESDIINITESIESDTAVSDNIFIGSDIAEVNNIVTTTVDSSSAEAEGSYTRSVFAEPDNINTRFAENLVKKLKLVEEVCDTEIDMANTQLRRLAADLETIMFQIDEIHDGMDTIESLSYNANSQTLNELKELRVSMVKVKKEIDFTRTHDDEYDYDQRFDKLLSSAKEDIGILKSTLSARDATHEKAQTEQEATLRWERDRKRAELVSKANAFQRSVTQVDMIFQSLEKAYSLFDMDMSRDAMITREKEKSSLSSEFGRMRDRVDKLTLQTDILIEDKEKILDRLAKYVHHIEGMKVEYEKKVHQDLVDHDLTADKLKLAESTKMNFGKFSGVLGKGDDYYTFKSKFIKAYGNHPKDLKVEWLKNNHLEGLAKEFVGSLDNIDEIWERLKSNFGNTEVMLKYHFGRINKMGQMHTFKSFDLKKTYIQCLINAMKDVIDLAEEHNLMGDVTYGPQLKKVVSLLDKHYQNEWYKLVADENVEKPQRWERMLRYLNGILSVLQLRASEEESADSSNVPKDPGYNKDKDSSVKGNKGGGGPRVNLAKGVCKLCNTTHPSSNTNFVQCKKFLLMSCKDRGDLVRKGKFCLQCLDGKTKFYDNNHECSDKWMCKDEFHAGYTQKLHFLLCAPHVENEGNKQLFQEFKTEVLTSEWQKKVFEGNAGYYIHHKTFLKKQTPAVDTKLEDCADLLKPVESVAHVDTKQEDHVDLPVAHVDTKQEDHVDLPVAHVDTKQEDHVDLPVPHGDTEIKDHVDLTKLAESTFLSTNNDAECEEIEDAANFGPPVFLLQPIPFNNEPFNLMLDSGL